MQRLVPLMVAVGVLTTSARAATVEEIPQIPPRRSLGPHLFIQRDSVTDPFTNSYIASTTGIAFGSAGGPLYRADGTPLNLRDDYKIFDFSLLAAGQWGIADFWAIRLRLLGSVYSGINDPGLVGVGVSTLVRGSFGSTFSFQVAEQLRLGFVIDVTWGPSIVINILDTIRQSASSGTAEGLVDTTSAVTVTPTLSLAWTFARGWGALFNATYANGVLEVNQATKDTDAVLVQAAVEVDLRELGGIPLGIGAEYSVGYSLARSRFRRYIAGLGFFYTGRPGLTLGVDLGYRRSPISSNEVFASSFSAAFSLRYTFD